MKQKTFSKDTEARVRCNMAHWRTEIQTQTQTQMEKHHSSFFVLRPQVRLIGSNRVAYTKDCVDLYLSHFIPARFCHVRLFSTTIHHSFSWKKKPHFCFAVLSTLRVSQFLRVPCLFLYFFDCLFVCFIGFLLSKFERLKNGKIENLFVEILGLKTDRSHTYRTTHIYTHTLTHTFCFMARYAEQPTFCGMYSHTRTTLLLCVLATLFLVVVFISSRIVQVGEERCANSGKVSEGPAVGTVTGVEQNPGVKFITLTFNETGELSVTDHNCALLSKHGYAYEIHTDDLSHSFCATCTCKFFRVQNCSCAKPHESQCNLCNKLAFFVDIASRTEQFVMLDSDLVILDHQFMPALLARAQFVDFLAAYGFARETKFRYTRQFNSGLMYVRRLDHLNYSKIFDINDEHQTNGDQIIISHFIHRYYERWDSLSLKWHCRFLYREEHSIPISHCLTFHGHQNARDVYLKNFTLSKTHSWFFSYSKRKFIFCCQIMVQ